MRRVAIYDRSCGTLDAEAEGWRRRRQIPKPDANTGLKNLSYSYGITTIRVSWGERVAAVISEASVTH